MILIRKVSSPYGWLGNMSPHPIVYEDKTYKTAEALFQCLRYDDPEIIEDIRKQTSPMSAKFVSKKHKDKMIIKPCSIRDLENMWLCLQLKIKQHPELKEKLLETRNQKIVEDCSNRQQGSALFWGMARVKREWIGENHLGRLWMKLRCLQK